MSEQDSTPIVDLLQAARRWHEAGQPDAAQLLAQRILARVPGHPEALMLLARLRPLHPVPEQRPTPQALAAASFNNRGAQEAACGEAEAALASYAAALALDPNHVEAWSNRGNSLQLAGQIDEALECYDRAITLRPDYGAAYANRGNALLALHRDAAALDSYRQAVALEPGRREAVNGMGAALAALHRPEEALAAFEQALALSPDFVEALVNRGAMLHRLGRVAEALVAHERAIALRPTHAMAHFNRGTTLMELRRWAEALESLVRAQSLQPDHADAHWNEALCRLKLGDYREGWRKHEWGWAAGQRGMIRDYGSQPQLGVESWLGEQPIAGITLLLHAEQGLGDTLQFCRYAALAREAGAQVVLEVQPPLVRLLRRMPGVAPGIVQVVAMGEALPPFHRRSPMLSLPLAFGTTLETVPQHIPYLHADPSVTAAWRVRLAGFPGRKIGLAWAGDPRLGQRHAGDTEHSVDQRRSMRLAQMAALAAVPGVTFVSLQKGDAASQAATPPSGMTLLDWTGELRDFADTADLVAALDLVITVDTAVAHLAGGLGRPVWVLNRYDGCWRWLLDRTDSPWYPTARIFRQAQPGDWNGVMADVVQALT